MTKLSFELAWLDAGRIAGVSATLRRRRTALVIEADDGTEFFFDAPPAVIDALASAYAAATEAAE
jgi:hypothetical protein